MKKNKTEPGYFNPDQYECWLTGIGLGSVARPPKTEEQVTKYLKREKKEKHENSNDR